MTDEPKVEPTQPGNGAKKWYESMTIRGVIVSVVGKSYVALRLILGMLGVHLPILPPELDGVLDTLIALVGSLVGDVMAIKGRIKATQKIG